MLGYVIIAVVYLLDLLSKLHQFSFDLIIICYAFDLITFEDHLILYCFSIEELSLEDVSAPGEETYRQSTALKCSYLLPLFCGNGEEMERTRHFLR